MVKLVLASGSPRRRELLSRLDLPFAVRPTAADEHVSGLSPRQTVKTLSRRKAEAAEAGPDEIVIAADTMVFLGNTALGKPTDEADALRMLTALQGRRHTVLTGVTVRQGGRYATESEESAVYFRPATEGELLRYIATGEPLDKAGAYGIQGKGALLVERIEGDYPNIVGLPLVRLCRMLEAFGVSVW